MSGNVLVLSHRRGFEADRVIDGLCARGIHVFRFNADISVPGTTISFRRGARARRATLRCDGRSLVGEDVRAAWLQQPPPFEAESVTQADALQRQNFLAGWWALVEQLDCAWVNRPACVFRAANKVLQLTAAAEAGLHIPPTLVSNDPEEIRAFSTQHTRIIAKNLSTPWFMQGDALLVAYTKLVDPNWLVSDEELSFAPVIYQQFCRRKRDYRLVSVCGRVYSVACQGEKAEQLYDIRRGSATGEGYCRCDPPRNVIEGVLRLMQNLELDYCSADLIETDTGELYFLDLNATGAWWWVDDLYNGAICRAFVEQLARRASIDQ